MLSLLSKYSQMFSWQGTKLGRTNIVKHAIDTGKARPSWQLPRRIPPPFPEEKEIVKDEAMKPFQSPWVSCIALLKKSDCSLRLCTRYGELNAVTKSDAFPLPQINDWLDSRH